MFASTSQSPASAVAVAWRAFKSAMTVQLGDPGPARRGPKARDVRHLDEHMLKDIGYAREDRMSDESREVLTRLRAMAYP
ncbi:hypothetical protein [Tropicimonas sp. IMCC6043]|uniref:hypothetical protein n=1 Tax=Tropicimonas sp. IMCC6043 TaxID=2510645 RepID=UPI00101CC266|nr:hypothetical protein [Tropicimonas sp. IMCC6043]RYH11393.1 hypothetical protein EU800_05895 [Tropicimonas sp. IMCC6043]